MKSEGIGLFLFGFGADHDAQQLNVINYCLYIYLFYGLDDC